MHLPDQKRMNGLVVRLIIAEQRNDLDAYDEADKQLGEIIEKWRDKLVERLETE